MRANHGGFPAYLAWPGWLTPQRSVPTMSTPSLVCRILTLSLGLIVLAGSVGSPAWAEEYDIVLRQGRVIDPESGLDAVRNVGIRGGVIQAVATTPLRGRTEVDARGLVIAPGFIDLHQHSHEPEDYYLKAQDGVTTVGELEIGTADVDAWYAAREGRSLINFCVSVGHIKCRMEVMKHPPAFTPTSDSAAALEVASEEQLEQLRGLIERGLQRGAVAVGMGLQYLPGANHWETIEMFRVAAKYRAPCHIHIRSKGTTGPANVYSALQELIASTVLTGAASHVCHVQSTSNRATSRMLQLITEARARGVDVSVECYPYTAGMGDIKSAIFDPGWQKRAEIDYGDLQWVATGERLTAETFARYRQSGGWVIVHSNSEELIRATVAHPLTMIASDGLRGHPRHAGTSARILGRYVREAKALTLMQAIDKLSLMPARRLEQRVPAMKNKGRVRVGADADLVVFDPETVIDRATYEQPDLSSGGIPHVLVAGIFVVRDGVLDPAAVPGSPVRAPISGGN